MSDRGKKNTSIERGSGGGGATAAGLDLIRERIRQRWSAPIARLIGFELTKAGPGTATVELEVGPQHWNPMGTLHGGVVCDIADAAMGIAYVTKLGKGESFTTMELKVNFLRPVWSGRIAAKAAIIKKGRTTGLVECRVTDESGNLVAYATSTCMTIVGGEGLERPRRGARRDRGEAPRRTRR